MNMSINVATANMIHAVDNSGVVLELSDARIDTRMVVRNLSFYYNQKDDAALKNVNMPIYKNRVTALIGPSGCGKSTMLRTLNRIYELYSTQRTEGEILLDGSNILKQSVDLNDLRSKVGMVFQKPTPFPMSIFENMASD